jgi:hypothetical protein
MSVINISLYNVYARKTLIRFILKKSGSGGMLVNDPAMPGQLLPLDG